MRTNTRNICTISIFAAALTSCGSAKTGTVELRATEAPMTATLTFSQINVTIDHVDAHVAGDKWQTIVKTPQTIDLAELQGGSFATIGVAKVPAGQITELRLFLSGNATVTTIDGKQEPLVVPSGDIKIVGFEAAECRTTAATLTFEGVDDHAADGKLVLRPTVQVTATDDEGPGACEDADENEGPETESKAD
jgi:hypothetical protein